MTNYVRSRNNRPSHATHKQFLIQKKYLRFTSLSKSYSLIILLKIKYICIFKPILHIAYAKKTVKMIFFYR